MLRRVWGRLEGAIRRRRMVDAMSETESLHVFLDEVRQKTADLSESERQLFELYLGEVAPAWRTIAADLNPGDRVLEVGAGIGALSSFIAQNGWDVVALEPLAEGIEGCAKFWQIISDATPGDAPIQRFDGRCEDLLAAGVEPFDFIFSNHVLEHVDDLEQLISTLSALLADGGRMVHICPNYRFPYEPHFGIPYLGSGRLTRSVFLPELPRNDPAWASLNFVGAGRLRRLARKNDLEIHFRPAILAESVERALADEGFRSRHKPAAWLAGLAVKLGLMPIVRSIPASFASPMIADIKPVCPK
jgi:2-polyprenyl-3-methyl-5-hydroxy-6-metoxy-1,4-benzoquinol methylase